MTRKTSSDRLIISLVMIPVAIVLFFVGGSLIARLTKPLECIFDGNYDGDTIHATCSGLRVEIAKVKIRLYCIDAPELKQEPWGRKSRDYLERVIPRQFNFRSSGKDRYERVLGEIIDPTDGSILNLRMVENGMAAVYRRYCNDSQYLKAEAKAKTQGKGIWEVPGLHRAPWKYRKLN